VSNLKVIKILIYCPLEVLYESVNLRNKLNIENENKLAFHFFGQLAVLYKLHKNDNDPIIEIVESKKIKDALIKASEDFLLSCQNAKEYKKKIDNFNKSFIKKFNLDKERQIVLSPAEKYNLIIDSSNSTALEIANQIKKIS
jgi:lysyl-tRNA synthetase class I